MMKQQRKRRFLIILFFFILLIPTVYSLGVAPAYEEIFFEPSYTQTFQAKIYGESESFDAKFVVTGDLAQYITLPVNRITVPSTGTEFSYTISLPEELRPGRHKTTIIIEQQQSSSSSAGQFGAIGALGYAVYVNVPYEGKYAEAKIDAPNVDLGQPVNFVVTVTNYGKENIESAKGIIEIYDQNGTRVTWIETDEKSISSETSAELYAHWTPTNVRAGVYTAKVVVTYDEKETVAETTFRIGDLFIDIIDIAPHIFEQGKIQKFSVQIQSFWSQSISNVYATIALQKDGATLDTITTAPLTLEQWATSELTGYWDTTAYDTGNYTATVTLYYEGKTTIETFSVSVNEKEEITKQEPQLEQAAAVPLFESQSFLMFLIVLTIIVFFIFFHKKQFSLGTMYSQVQRRIQQQFQRQRTKRNVASGAWTKREKVLFVLLCGVLLILFFSYTGAFASLKNLTGYATASLEQTAEQTAVSAKESSQGIRLADAILFVFLLVVIYYLNIQSMLLKEVLAYTRGAPVKKVAWKKSVKKKKQNKIMQDKISETAVVQEEEKEKQEIPRVAQEVAVVMPQTIPSLNISLASPSSYPKDTKQEIAEKELVHAVTQFMKEDNTQKKTESNIPLSAFMGEVKK